MITSCSSYMCCAQLKDLANLICVVFSKKIYQRSLIMFKSDMADEFQGGICGGNLWNGSTDFFGSSTCSISSWPYNQESFVTDIKASSSRSSDDSTASDGNILQDAENTQQTMSTYHEWHQDLIFDNEQSEGNYSYIVPQDSTCAVDSSMMNYWEQISDLVNCPQTVLYQSCQSTSTTDPNFLANNSNPYSHTSSLSRSLFDADSLRQRKQQSLLENNPEMSYLSGILRTRDESHIAKPSYSKPSSTQPQFLPPSHRSKTRAHLHSLSAKNEEPRDFGSAVKKAGNESAGTKRARVETPSPLPTFKVRKEKLGDRVTALQQLVSPFGKTDTASVLHEAIEYIKFLHDQVSALSAPYLKNGSPRLQHHRQVNHDLVDDLKSRGLCLVPISSTFPIAAETTADLWTPTLFGQSFR